MSARKAPSDKQIIKDYKTMSSGNMALKYSMTRTSVCKHIGRLGIARPLSGPNSRNKKRHGEVIKSGYPVLHLPKHKRSTAVGYVFKHILTVEKRTGKCPKKGEPIHHIDLLKLNYKDDNLYLCKNHSEHQAVHSSLDDVARQLIKNGIIKFKNGRYYL